MSLSGNAAESPSCSYHQVSENVETAKATPVKTETADYADSATVGSPNALDLSSSMGPTPTPSPLLSPWPILVCNHLGILFTGLLCGFVFWMPNVMASDAGTSRALMAAKFGMFASVLFVIGGVVGAITGRWIALFPAVACQIVVFILLGN